MKKLFALLLCLALLAGCGSTAAPAKDGKLNIVTTIFPEYDWVREILGDRAEQVNLTMLLDSGVDLHSYQPTAEDMIKISTCDLFLYVGGESDTWVADALEEATNPDMLVINLLDVLGESAREEEVVEGMETGEEAEEAGEIVYDEHVWLSVKNAKILCQAIADSLCQLDADNADAYRSNVAAYVDKLDVLDTEYQTAVDSAAQKVILFGDRFPFRYLTDDYGLTYYAAFLGCSAETEASFATITFLADKVDEYGLTTVLTLEGSEHQIAQTVVANTAAKNQQILTMDSMQSVTAAHVAEGASYLALMQANLEALKTALGV